MTTQRRNFVRTARKEKSWAFTNAATTITATNTGSIDLLTAYHTDLGILSDRNVTAMRIIGQVQLQELANASGAAYVHVDLGFAWINPATAVLNTPPWEIGVREIEWIQLGHVEGTEVTSGALLGRPALARPNEACQWDVDIKQMRTCPTPAHRLQLVFSTNGLQENGTLQLDLRIGVMLALP